MSQPTDSLVGELEQVVVALVGLARDRGATAAQRATLGGIWAGLQAGSLSGATTPELQQRATSLAADLLGVDALLAPANAPYGGFWQEVEARLWQEVEARPTPHAAVGRPGEPLGARRTELRAFLTDRVPSWADLASRGLTGPLPFIDACEVIEELARVVAPGPYLQTLTLLQALPADERERVAAGEASWVLATGPLVMDLDLATSVAIVGGDGIFELVGAERELLVTRDESRPLGVVVGGEPGRRLGNSSSLPLLRRRLLVGLAFEALGVISVIGVIGAPESVAGARALADHAARLVDADDADAEPFAAAAKAVACEVAFTVSAQALTSASPDARPRLERLHERSRFIRAWEAPPAQLLTEIGELLLVETEE